MCYAAPVQTVFAMNHERDRSAEPTVPQRGYGGVRITAPPRKPEIAGIGLSVLAGQNSPGEPLNSEHQVRILIGSALFGVVLVVLLHEFGHWLAGLAITGRFPDYYIVAVRQKVEHFSTADGIITWGAGPVVQAVVLWGLVLIALAKGQRSPRLLAMAGGAAIFSLVTHLGTWAFATFSSSESWGNDLPRVATLLGSSERSWMHLLNAVFFTTILIAGYRWWKLTRSAERPGLYASSAAIGAFEGGILVLFATLFIAIGG